MDRKLVHQRNLRQYNNGAEASARVYVNEHLSPGNRKLFAMASQKKSELNYKFLWTKNGTVLVRKDETARVLKIESADDIARMT